MMTMGAVQSIIGGGRRSTLTMERGRRPVATVTRGLVVMFAKALAGLIALPGAVLTIITLPGLMCATWVKARCCQRYSVEVHELSLVRLGWPPSALEYSLPASLKQTVGVLFRPWLVLSGIGFGVFLVARYGMVKWGLNVAVLALLWVGVCLVSHIQPEREQARQLRQQCVAELRARHWLTLPGLLLLTFLYVLFILDAAMPIPFPVWPWFLWFVAFVLVSHVMGVAAG